MDCSPPGSSVPGVLQARILEWIVIPYSRASSWPRNQTWVACIAGSFFTVWAAREALEILESKCFAICNCYKLMIVSKKMLRYWPQLPVNGNLAGNRVFVGDQVKTRSLGWDLAQQDQCFYIAVQLISHVWLFVTPWTAACQASLSSTISQVCSDSCPLSQWCHPTISSSVGPFFSCLQCFPVSGSFPMCWLFASGGQSIGASALASVLPMNIQGWFPLGLIGLISF